MLILEAAIVKGLYLALGGTKGILLPSRYDNVTQTSKVIFKYKIKTKNNSDYYSLLKVLKQSNINYVHYINLNFNNEITNDMLASLAGNIIIDKYKNEQDPTINNINIQLIILGYLNYIDNN